MAAAKAKRDSATIYRHRNLKPAFRRQWDVIIDNRRQSRMASWTQKFLRALARNDVRVAADLAGSSVAAVYRLRRRDPDFNLRFELELKKRTGDLTTKAVGQAIPPLSESQQDFLDVLYDLGAFSAAMRVSIADAAAKTEATAGTLLQYVRKLRTCGLVETREGRGGGCWLTGRGKDYVARMRT